VALFDPEKGFTDSKDIPCNTWLNWIARGGKLHLSVASAATTTYGSFQALIHLNAAFSKKLWLTGWAWTLASEVLCSLLELYSLFP
jgi:hypothetical protein